MFKSVEDLQKFSSEQMELAAQSASALSQGFGKLITETTALSKQAMESGTGALQDLAASRSLDRVMQIQADFAKSTYDSMLDRSSKIGGIMSATAQDVFKPIEGLFAKMQGAGRT